ncbi:hypothetical protein [Actinophytocola sediminis]
MIHTRIQLDPGAEISLRAGSNGTVEVVIQDPGSECSSVIEMSPEQLAAIRQGDVITW